MSAPIRSETVLSRTSEALTEALSRSTPTALGRALGRSHSTISRGWQDDLAAWPAADFLRLACTDLSLRSAVIAALQNAPEILPEATPAAAARELMQSFAREIDRIIDRVSDGNFDQREGALTDAELDAICTSISQLRALIRSNRKRQ